MDSTPLLASYCTCSMYTNTVMPPYNLRGSANPQSKYLILSDFETTELTLLTVYIICYSDTFHSRKA